MTRPSSFHGAFVVPMLIMVTMAGCLNGGDVPPPPVDDGPEPVPDYFPVDEALLSEPVHTLAQVLDQRIPASTDGISLFAEVYLPDGDGPWPTIMHSTSYKHLDKGIAAAFGNGLVDFYVPRGYAVVLADVRGFGDSEGCVEVWGKNEQQDQYDLVEWAAAQAWSDGKVGMIGASYPGTTPIEAAVMAPPHLTTIVTAAGLTDPYYDWHYGGVPTGESGPDGSPLAYQAIGAAPPIEPVPDPARWMMAAANGGCGTAELITDAYQMDSVYTAYYEERNLAARADRIEASVLYMQGFTDGNVKPSQLLGFFNEIQAPKKGIFGQWAHQFPVRDDYKALEHAWFDHWLKDIDNGIMKGPTVEVITNDDTWRPDHAFPNAEAVDVTALHLDASDMSLRFEAPTEDANVDWTADRRPSRLFGADLQPAAAPVYGHDGEASELWFKGEPLEEELYLSGVMWFSFNATMDAENAYFMAALYEVGEDDRGEETRTRIAFGGLAAALRNDVRQYDPVPTGETVEYRLRFQPREYIVDEGSRLELRIYTPDVLSATTDEAIGPVQVTFHTGPSDGSLLELPLIDGRPDIELPWPQEPAEEESFP